MTGWRPNGDQIRAGALAGADLSRFDLQGFHFRRADLRGASFARQHPARGRPLGPPT